MAPERRKSTRLGTALFGSATLARQVQTHALSSAADAFFTVSLAGSLFFNVSIDAARPRIIVYLLLTMAPFTVVAPLIGRSIDRVAGGPRVIVALACFGRGVVCLLLARDLRDLLFFPEAFAVLVLAKSYSVARSALVPRLVDDSEELVAANARLARTATISSAVGGAVAAGILNLANPAWVLRAGALVFAGAFGLALLLPRPGRRPAVSRLVESEELRAPRLVRMAMATTGLRAAVGFLLFHLGFALRKADEPAWFFGAVFVASGAGALGGSLAAPWMRRHIPEERMLSVALAVPAIVALAASPATLRFGALMIAVALGSGATTGRQAFDSLVQRDAPDADRGRAFARYETRFQFAWVVGALAAVAARPPFWLGLLALALVLGLGALLYTTGSRPAAGREVESGPSPLSVEVLRAAQRSLAEGRYRLAVVEAALAAEVFFQEPTGHQGVPADRARSAAAGAGRDSAGSELEAMRRAATRPGVRITKGEAAEAVALAGRIILDDHDGGRGRSAGGVTEPEGSC